MGICSILDHEQAKQRHYSPVAFNASCRDSMELKFPWGPQILVLDFKIPGFWILQSINVIFSGTQSLQALPNRGLYIKRVPINYYVFQFVSRGWPLCGDGIARLGLLSLNPKP